MEENRIAGLAGKIFSAVSRYRYVLLVAALGVFLMLLPTEKRAETDGTQPEMQSFDREKEQREMEAILSRIEGAGKLRLMLTVRGSGEYELARNETRAQKDSSEKGEYSSTTETVVLGNGANAEVVVTNSRYPDYIGALVVCEGAGSAGVRLRLTQAVGALTGLTSDKISVVKGKP